MWRRMKSNMRTIRALWPAPCLSKRAQHEAGCPAGEDIRMAAKAGKRASRARTRVTKTRARVRKAARKAVRTTARKARATTTRAKKAVRAVAKRASAKRTGTRRRARKPESTMGQFTEAVREAVDDVVGTVTSAVTGRRK